VSTGRSPSGTGTERGSDQRWFSHQPNVTGAGLIASYSLRFWSLVIVLGLVAGVGAGALILLLRGVEHLAFGGHAHTLLGVARAAPAWRHVVVLLLAAVIVIIGLRVLGRLPIGGMEVSESLWVAQRPADVPAQHRSGAAVHRHCRDGGLAWA
jgi:hypothetical protein